MDCRWQPVIPAAIAANASVKTRTRHGPDVSEGIDEPRPKPDFGERSCREGERVAKNINSCQDLKDECRDMTGSQQPPECKHGNNASAGKSVVGYLCSRVADIARQWLRRNGACDLRIDGLVVLQPGVERGRLRGGNHLCSVLAEKVVHDRDDRSIRALHGGIGRITSQ